MLTTQALGTLTRFLGTEDEEKDKEKEREECGKAGKGSYITSDANCKDARRSDGFMSALSRVR